MPQPVEMLQQLNLITETRQQSYKVDIGRGLGLGDSLQIPLTSIFQTRHVARCMWILCNTTTNSNTNTKLISVMICSVQRLDTNADKNRNSHVSICWNKGDVIGYLLANLKTSKNTSYINIILTTLVVTQIMPLTI